MIRTARPAKMAIIDVRGYDKAYSNLARATATATECENPTMGCRKRSPLILRAFFARIGF